jgi:hypothetical protein
MLEFIQAETNIAIRDSLYTEPRKNLNIIDKNVVF